MYMSKIVVLLSGGMDSTVLAHHLNDQGHELRALAFNYGQRHVREVQAAEAQADILKIPFSIADLAGLRDLLPGSSQTDPTVAVPTGHYTAENMKATVVPNRNMILLAIAVGHAIAHGCDAVAYAAHAGDHAIYPDCRPEFVDALQLAVNLCDEKHIDLERPFIRMTKNQIVSLGQALHVPFQNTWTCYVGGSLHCGRCGTCVERREAFFLAGIEDPVKYAKDAPSTESLVKSNWRF